MREAGREALGDEPILAIVSNAEEVQYVSREKLLDIIKQQNHPDFTIGEATPSMTDETYMAKVGEIQ